MDNEIRYLWLYGPALYLFFAFVILIISIAPMAYWYSAIFPQTLFAITFAVMLRNAIIVPLWAIAIVFLARDLLYFQPIGIEALLAVLIFNTVRNARRGLAETYFTEWGGFAIAVATMLVLKLLLGRLFGVEIYDLWLQLRSAVFTIVIYPVITGALSFQFGLVKQAQA